MAASVHVMMPITCTDAVVRCKHLNNNEVYITHKSVFSVSDNRVETIDLIASRFVAQKTRVDLGPPIN